MIANSMQRLAMFLCVFTSLVLFGSASASTLGLQTKTERRHRRHRLHHKHKRSHHKVSKKKHKDILEQEMTVETALESMPSKVDEVFAQFQSSKSATTATAVVDELNLVYERALTQKDAITPACEDKRFELAKEVRVARDALKDVEGHLTRLQGHMQSVQTGIDRNLAEVESLRQQYTAHKELCKKNADDSSKLLASLQEDMPKATNIKANALYGCSASSTPPALVSCSLPSGELVTTFKKDTLRTLIANVTGVSEKILALNLDRAVRASAATASMFLQVKSQRLRGASKKSSLRRTHKRTQGRHQLQSYRSTSRIANGTRHNATGLVQRSSEETSSIPSSWCTDVSPTPACDTVTDTLATFVGNVEDLVRDLLSKSRSQEEHCATTLEEYEQQVKLLTRDADDGSVELGNAAAEHSELANLRRERRAQVQDMNNEAEREVATCGQQIHDFDTTLCSAKKLKKELGTNVADGTFLGDCEVGDWIRGPCNATCGDSGSQTMTRDIIKSDGTSPKCPALSFERPCNRKPCPVDGVMGLWDEWSGCSRACGGGTRARHRKVEVESRNGGLPTAETMQEQLCNTQSCDQDCLLDDWTPWTNCSKLCGLGHKARSRKSLRLPLGEGSCPGERDPARLQTQFCNREACSSVITSATPKCTKKLDVVLVLDASGSAGAAGTEYLKNFAKAFVDVLVLDATDGSTAGIISYGSTATVGTALTADSASLVAAYNGVTWIKGSTNTAQALAVARNLFEENGRVTAQQVAIIVTDGMPESSFLTGVEVGRLTQEGIRVMFIGVGKSVSKHVLRRWATWPWEENVISASTYTELNTDKFKDVLANVCGESVA
jgi:uncharacterized protein YegL